MDNDSPRAISVATGLGALSSSCSYVAVTLARALFRKGASFSAAMNMSVAGDQGFWRRLFSRPCVASVSQYFVMDRASVLRDIVIGLFIAGAFEAWVPKAWLQTVFLQGNPTLAFFIDPLIGPLVAMVSFVCSAG